MKVLVLGATGLLGNMLFRVLSESSNLEVFGTIRQESSRRFFDKEISSRLVIVKSLENVSEIEFILDNVNPEVVINCISLEQPFPKEIMRFVSIFALLPKRLSYLCKLRSMRLIQMSTDGVFSGDKGNYKEDDIPDADDIYGTSKMLGELVEPHTITLRTSIIGHSLQGKSGLLEWFLTQENICHCYTRAIFSGFPTVILSQLIRDYIIPRQDLYGIYHVSSQSISKYELLKLVAMQYDKKIEIMPDDKLAINRSLDSARFQAETGYIAPKWPELIKVMHSCQ